MNNFLKLIITIGIVVLTSVNIEGKVLNKEQELKITVVKHQENGDVMINVECSPPR